jgi:surface antigen
MLQTSRKAMIYGLFITCAAQFAAHDVSARSINSRHIHYTHGTSFSYRTQGWGSHVIQCVAFAKQDAGIEISGNARDWWSNAAGVYARGHRPEVGSVLSFRANDRMPLGHVAVVANIEDSRTITIDQSHWNSSGITRDIEVKDVSEDNDWSAVRVQLAHEDSFGSIYPTHGFIYARPDEGTIVQASVRAPMPNLGPAPADLRRHLRRERIDLEVAEVPVATRGLDLSLNGIASDAPDRDFR